MKCNGILGKFRIYGTHLFAWSFDVVFFLKFNALRNEN